MTLTRDDNNREWHLTEKQAIVMNGLLGDLSNKEISAITGYGLKTIEGVVSDLLRATASRSRAGLALWGIQHRDRTGTDLEVLSAITLAHEPVSIHEHFARLGRLRELRADHYQAELAALLHLPSPANTMTSPAVSSTTFDLDELTRIVVDPVHVLKSEIMEQVVSILRTWYLAGGFEPAFRWAKEITHILRQYLNATENEMLLPPGRDDLELLMSNARYVASMLARGCYHLAEASKHTVKSSEAAEITRPFVEEIERLSVRYGAELGVLATLTRADNLYIHGQYADAFRELSILRSKDFDKLDRFALAAYKRLKILLFAFTGRRRQFFKYALHVKSAIEADANNEISPDMKCAILEAIGRGAAELGLETMAFQNLTSALSYCTPFSLSTEQVTNMSTKAVIRGIYRAPVWAPVRIIQIFRSLISLKLKSQVVVDRMLDEALKTVKQLADFYGFQRYLDYVDEMRRSRRIRMRQE